jgi:hypothetical protein
MFVCGIMTSWSESRYDVMSWGWTTNNDISVNMNNTNDLLVQSVVYDQYDKQLFACASWHHEVTSLRNVTLWRHVMMSWITNNDISVNFNNTNDLLMQSLVYKHYYKPMFVWGNMTSWSDVIAWRDVMTSCHEEEQQIMTFQWILITLMTFSCNH